MKIQVFGPCGMLGSAVVKAIGKRGHEWDGSDVNLEMVTGGHIRAETVINCAGIVKQRMTSASHMMRVNAVGPHLLAEACDAAGARLIHISTDCVFCGPGPHDEADSPSPADDYARSKLAGEIHRTPHLTIRTSFVGFGRHGLIARMQRPNTEERASARVLWSGHTVNTIADLLVTLAERRDVIGLLHVPGEYQTRLDVCTALKARYSLPAKVERDDGYAADRRLTSDLWDGWNLPDLPGFATQLELMERP